MAILRKNPVISQLMLRRGNPDFSLALLQSLSRHLTTDGGAVGKQCACHYAVICHLKCEFLVNL